LFGTKSPKPRFKLLKTNLKIAKIKLHSQIGACKSYRITFLNVIKSSTARYIASKDICQEFTKDVLGTWRTISGFTKKSPATKQV